MAVFGTCPPQPVPRSILRRLNYESDGVENESERRVIVILTMSRNTLVLLLCTFATCVFFRVGEVDIAGEIMTFNH